MHQSWVLHVLNQTQWHLGAGGSQLPTSLLSPILPPERDLGAPQVPVLFTGSLRFNLTPFGEHSDADCWAALRRAHLADMIEGTGQGLDLVLTEGGAPLSAGQKQLVALARALLRHSKVLATGQYHCVGLHPQQCLSWDAENALAGQCPVWPISL